MLTAIVIKTFKDMLDSLVILGNMHNYAYLNYAKYMHIILHVMLY